MRIKYGTCGADLIYVMHKSLENFLQCVLLGVIGLVLTAVTAGAAPSLLSAADDSAMVQEFDLESGALLNTIDFAGGALQIDRFVAFARRPTNDEIWATVLDTLGVFHVVTLDETDGTYEVVESDVPHFVGLAFNAGGAFLYGVTGEDADLPHRVYRISTFDGAVNLNCDASAGISATGVTIGFSLHLETDTFYRFVADSVAGSYRLEVLNVFNCGVTPAGDSIPVTVEGFAYIPALNEFLLASSAPSQLYRISTTGVTTEFDAVAPLATAGVSYQTIKQSCTPLFGGASTCTADPFGPEPDEVCLYVGGQENGANAGNSIEFTTEFPTKEGGGICAPNPGVPEFAFHNDTWPPRGWQVADLNIVDLINYHNLGNLNDNGGQGTAIIYNGDGDTQPNFPGFMSAVDPATFLPPGFPIPYSTRVLRLSIGAPFGGFDRGSLVLSRFGSEDVTVTVLKRDGNGTVVQNATTFTGDGERQFRRDALEIVPDGAAVVGDGDSLRLDFSYTGAGSDNGFYIDQIGVAAAPPGGMTAGCFPGCDQAPGGCDPGCPFGGGQGPICFPGCEQTQAGCGPGCPFGPLLAPGSELEEQTRRQNLELFAVGSSQQGLLSGSAIADEFVSNSPSSLTLGITPAEDRESPRLNPVLGPSGSPELQLHFWLPQGLSNLWLTVASTGSTDSEVLLNGQPLTTINGGAATAHTTHRVQLPSIESGFHTITILGGDSERLLDYVIVDTQNEPTALFDTTTDAPRLRRVLRKRRALTARYKRNTNASCTLELLSSRAKEGPYTSGERVVSRRSRGLLRSRAASRRQRFVMLVEYCDDAFVRASAPKRIRRRRR